LKNSARNKSCRVSVNKNFFSAVKSKFAARGPVRILLSAEQVDKIERFLSIRHEQRREVITALTDLFSGVSGAESAITELGRISNHLSALGYHEDRAQIDLSVARGLAYYTGPVFEAILLDAPEFGSVFGGGRYDDLVQRFPGSKRSSNRRVDRR
jgi:histidyl-tRNA synthetase